MERAVDPRFRVIWLALIGCASVGIAGAVFYLGPLPAGSIVSSLFWPVIAFSLFAFAVRWFIVRELTANVLGTRLLAIIGSAKIVLFLALLVFIFECLIGAIIRPTAQRAMFGTFVSGLIAFAVLNITVSGVANTIVIIRKLLKQ